MIALIKGKLRPQKKFATTSMSKARVCSGERVDVIGTSQRGCGRACRDKFQTTRPDSIYIAAFTSSIQSTHSAHPLRLSLAGRVAMSPTHYDLIVIGSGPAGEKGAAQAAYFGKRVALIERESVLGGAAANTGTLPSKTLRETALYLSGFRQRGLYGVKMQLKDRVTARDFLYRERQVQHTEHLRIIANLKRHRIDLYKGQASFVDPHTVRLENRDATPVVLKG